MSQMPKVKEEAAEEVGELFSANRARLLRYILNRVSDRGGAEDLVQEVFAEYLRLSARNATEAIKDPSRYLYGIAVHVVSDHQRRVASRKPRADLFEAEVTHRAAEEATESPDQAVERFEIQLALNRALEAALPVTHRRVMVLTYNRGLSHVEAARVLELSEHTVKKYIVESLVLLRKHWKREPNGEAHYHER